MGSCPYNCHLRFVVTSPNELDVSRNINLEMFAEMNFKNVLFFRMAVSDIILPIMHNEIMILDKTIVSIQKLFLTLCLIRIYIYILIVYTVFY